MKHKKKDHRTITYKESQEFYNYKMFKQESEKRKKLQAQAKPADVTHEVEVTKPKM